MAGATGWVKVLGLSRSAPIALVALVLANLVPLIGVLFFGWDVALILLVYWLENGVVGLLTLPRILLAAGPSSMTVRDIGGLGRSNGGIAVFFVLHYGLFWVIHGVFLVVLTGIVPSPGLTDPLLVVLGDPRLVLAGLALLISHAADFWLNYVGRGEFRTASAGGEMLQPYPRLIVLHIVITAGAILIMGRQTVLAIAMLVALKTVIDVAIFMFQHRGQPTSSAT
jgi:hypothetical protein